MESSGVSCKLSKLAFVGYDFQHFSLFFVLTVFVFVFFQMYLKKDIGREL